MEQDHKQWTKPKKKQKKVWDIWGREETRCGETLGTVVYWLFY